MIISLSWKKIVFAIITCLVLIFVQQVRAQSPSPNQTSSPKVSASPSPSSSPQNDKAVTFPITELGGCENKGECIKFCDDPVNYNTCADYAKKKGFYVPDKVQSADDKFWEKTKNGLGCNSQEECLKFCEQDANKDKCDGYAKKEDLIGGFVQEPDQPQFLDQAKKTLGCDSAQSCSTFCDDSKNSQKCNAFAEQVGLLGGEVKSGPGGCQSEGTCQSFCSDPNNFDKCKPYAPPNTQFQGPGGCSDPNGCRSYCEQNPDNCRSYSPGSNGRYVPVTCPSGQYFGPGGACTSNDKTEQANSCAQGGKYWSGQSCQDNPPPGIDPKAGGAFFQARTDMGNCKTPGQCYDFCKENPGKCQGFASNTSRPPDTYIPSLYYTPGTTVRHEPIKEMGNCATPGGCYDFCKENPGKCQGFDAKSPRPLDTFVPGTYYTPPREYAYATPPLTGFYVTPVYYTPPPGSNYTSPSYYTPGIYSTPSYYTPGTGYSTPTYYTPGSYYSTPQGGYPTPSYSTPSYYTPPPGSNYNTPSYYTPATYTSPTYYTPPPGSNYASPTYGTPPAYTTPVYYTPYTGGNYTTPIYYTPPPGSNYTTPNYSTPVSYVTPQYYTPPPGSTYTSPAAYYSPGSYVSPSYSSPPPGSNYLTPTYYSPNTYYTPGGPPPTGTGSYSTPYYTYPTPSGSYATPPSYNTPSGSYSYPSPGSYNTPSYSTPPPGPPPPPPSYSTPPPPPPGPPPPPAEPPPPPPPPPPGANAGAVAGTSTGPNIFQLIWNFLFGVR